MTKHESFALTNELFAAQFKQHPDLLEHWAILLDGITDQDERQRIMWAGLAATIRQRYPNAAADAEVDAQPPLRCKVCSKIIESAELCVECAKGNDPFKAADNCGADLR